MFVTEGSGFIGNTIFVFAVAELSMKRLLWFKLCRYFHEIVNIPYVYFSLLTYTHFTAPLG